jgi:hypothetical protein
VPGYRQIVAGLEYTWRVIAFDCEIPSTVYAKVPSFAPVNVNVPTPTSVTPTVPIHGLALNAGPVVR